MERINEVLAEAIKRHGGNKAEIARKLRGKLKGITPQGIGYYEKGREIPRKFITAWREIFQEDLETLSETGVSRETRSSFWDEITEGDYIGLHKRVWAEVEATMQNDRLLLMKMSDSLAEAIRKLGPAGA